MQIRLFFFLYFLTTAVLSAAQVNRGVAIDGYINREYIYFDSVSALNRSELKHLDSAYDCFVSFKIDTSAVIVSFKITELPVCPLPSVVKRYIKKLFASANGNWLPQLKNSCKVISDEMIWSVRMVKADQSIGERMKVMERLVEYYLEPPPPDEKISKFYAHPDKAKTIALAY